MQVLSKSHENKETGITFLTWSMGMKIELAWVSEVTSERGKVTPREQAVVSSLYSLWDVQLLST